VLYSVGFLFTALNYTPMSISFLVHQGKEVMFADYTKSDTKELQLELLEKVAATMQQKGRVRLLVDYNGVTAGTDYMSKIKDYGNTVFKEHMVCSATLGITGLKKILFNGYNRATGATNVKIFEDREAALDWLVGYE
jgi:hypothetical protein